MTNEEIIELAFNCGIRSETLQDKNGYDSYAYISSREELLKFALAIHENGYNKGYDEGREDGWESCQVSNEWYGLEEL